MAITSFMSDNDTTSGSHQVAGRQAEDLAERYLVKQGLSVLARNFRCRGGEIDLVCREGKTLVFVEVRLRRNTHYGGASASIDLTKQRRIILAARHFLAAQRADNGDCRFDCVLLSSLADRNVEWIRDAFSADY
jgi:putative endonuclease